MTGARLAQLSDRGVVRVAGEDAARLLQGIITNDMDLLATQPAIHAALLTPQGKIMFEFFVVKSGDGFLLETAIDKVADLTKRLAMYKLRAKATIEDLSQSYVVVALWGELPSQLPWDEAAVNAGDEYSVRTDIHILWLERYRDPRLYELGERWLLPTQVSREPEKHPNVFEIVEPDAYHAHRIALGVPEAGRDYPLADTFPHEADFDLLNGASFTKGCFVGQEVVSRMQNRATVRKRVVPIRGDAPLTTGTDITAGAAVIGTVGSVAGTDALAMLRLDRVAEAKSKGEPLRAGGIPITLRMATWGVFDLAPTAAEVT